MAVLWYGCALVWLCFGHNVTRGYSAVTVRWLGTSIGCCCRLYAVECCYWNQK